MLDLPTEGVDTSTAPDLRYHLRFRYTNSRKTPESLTYDLTTNSALNQAAQPRELVTA